MCLPATPKQKQTVKSKDEEKSKLPYIPIQVQNSVVTLENSLAVGQWLSVLPCDPMQR